LEGDKSKKVAKTNVWVMVKRNGKYLQGLEDTFKEIKERDNWFKQQGQRTQ